MAIIEGWLPPSRENWELVTWLFQFFPLFTAAQWLTTWYPMGKTSIQSRFNIPGKIGWVLMESPGFLTLLYIMYSLPKQLGIEKLPMQNNLMAGLYILHYLYRAVISPLFLNPSMSPIHVFVWLSAFTFQVVNATCIGGWLAGYGPTTALDWAGRRISLQLGLMIFAGGLISNILHDDELREIRRAAARKQARKEQDKGKHEGVNKVYMVPEGLLFKFILYPHYFSEWIEWIGFWVIGGSRFLPGQSFVLNEIAAMLPRALSGREWYVKKFGTERIGKRKAVIPGIL